MTTITMGTTIFVVFVVISPVLLEEMMGGWRQGDPHDKKIQDIAQFAMTTLNQRSNALYLSKVVHIIHAETQVVAGINYKLEIRIGATNCRKGRDDGKDLASECDLNNGGTKVCEVEVLEQIWLESRTLTSWSCNADSVASDPEPASVPAPVPNVGPIPGGRLQVDENSEEAQNALTFAIDELNTRHDQPKRAMISDVISVHRQVVAGIKYTIKLNLSPSVCDNNEQNHGATISQCPIARKPELEECEISVLYQAWMTPPYQLLDPISCNLKANPLYYKGKLLGRKIMKSKHADATMNQSQNEVIKLDLSKEPEIFLREPLYGGQDDHDVVSWGAFAQYMEEYNKVYDRKEMESRYKIFAKNMLKAKRMTEKEQGTAVYGPNEFSDMSEEEFARYYRNPVWDTSYDPSLEQAEIPEEAAPASFDWRDHNAVTEVKNQGMCGSCWAFSTTGNIEGQWALNKGKLLSLSEQELVDCDKLDQGCEGGLPTNAYKEIRRLGGLETEKQYPYEGEDDKCVFKASESRVYINGSVNITKDEGKMAQWLAKNGPISIGINANMMQFYLGGVSHPWKFFCSPESLDHGVLIVGYGTKKGYFSNTPYWIVKNSWGASWGEKGYYLVYRGDGTCGLNQMCTSAKIN